MRIKFSNKIILVKLFDAVIYPINTKYLLINNNLYYKIMRYSLFISLLMDNMYFDFLYNLKCKSLKI